MEMQISHSVCTEIPKTNHLPRAKSGYRKDTENVMRAKESNDYRSRMLPKPYPHAGRNTPPLKRGVVYGISQKQECVNDIRQAREPKV